jgi:hypothetical protein
MRVLGYPKKLIRIKLKYLKKLMVHQILNQIDFMHGALNK